MKKSLIVVLTCLMMTTLVLANDSGANKITPQQEMARKQRVFAEAETLEKAAANREAAAESQVKEALSAISLANALRMYDRGTALEKKNMYCKAGDSEMRAAGLCLAAAANYEKAASSWSVMADSFKGIGETDNSGEAVLLVKADLESARNLYNKAAEYYEQAAGAYRSEKGARPDMMAAASERAASIRERALTR
jgi:hypothetical protein